MNKYIIILIANFLTLILIPGTYASSRTWTINGDTSITQLPFNATLNSSSGPNAFVNEDNIIFTTAPQNNVYELAINKPDTIIGDLLWCSGVSPIILEPGAIFIGTPIYPLTLTIKPKSINVNIAFIDYAGADNKLILDSSSLSPNSNLTQHDSDLDNLPLYAASAKAATFIGLSYQSLVNSDSYGNLELHASVNPLGHSFVISTGSNKRLKSLTFSGDSLIEGDIYKNVYTENIIFNTSGTVILPQTSMGDDSAINLEHDLKIGTIKIGNDKGKLILGELPIINLNKHKFNLADQLSSESIYGFKYVNTPNDTGLLLEAHSPAIKTYFDKNLQNGAGDGGRFIVAGTSQIHIYDNMTITLETNANTAGLSYHLFSGQGVIDVPNADRILGNKDNITDSTIVNGNIITFNQPPPGVIYWTYDKVEHVISSHINPVQNIPQPGAPVSNNQNPRTTPAITTITFTDTSVLPNENITLAVARLVPSNFGKVASDEANDTAIRDVTSRAFKIPEDDFMGVAGVSSGETDKQYSGVWVSSFIQKARQKDINNVYGYKINNYGGTLGGDLMLGDNFALGMAWTTLNANVRLSGFKVGDKSSVDTNILSIYSLYNLPNRWFVQSHASAGQSKVKGEEWRYRSDNSLGIATAKYKSYSYNVHANIGKRIYTTPTIDFIPSIGLVYNNVQSDRYKEYGEVPTLAVAKRSSNALDAILSARLYGRYEYQDFIIKPEVSATAQSNISRRNMKMHYTGDFIEPANVEVRQSKRWYSLGAGMTIYKGMMEYAFDYEAQIDKKYLGHVGMLKIRMNL